MKWEKKMKNFIEKLQIINMSKTLKAVKNIRMKAFQAKGGEMMMKKEKNSNK